VGSWEFEWPLRHTVYLELPAPLTVGSEYQIQFADEQLPAQTFRYDPDQIYSEAVHVSQLGFAPDDPAKAGFLSLWMGNGGGLDYPEGLTFWLVDERSNQKVYSGQTQLSKAQDEPEDPRDRNYNNTNVYWMDFSNFQETGDYRLCVETVGCSYPFEISPTTWQEAFRVSARGFYHQRSGIELKAPYTAFDRPRAFHPDDGTVVYQSEAKLMDTTMGIGNLDAFDALEASKTNTALANAWGGYFDAGDWDRRIQHLWAARSLLELLELFPDYFQTVDLNLPESNNDLPDILDEALWGVEFFQRLQTPAGGIRGGVESLGHPDFGEASWQESQTVVAYAPDVWSTYIYAGVAARASRLLAPYQPERAQSLQNSALRAMANAEDEYANLNSRTISHRVKDERNLAALELFAATQDSRWHELFQDTTVFIDGSEPMYRWKHHSQRQAAFLYVRLDNPQINPSIQANARRALFAEADTLVQLAAETGFKWSKSHPETPVGWGAGFGTPRVKTMLWAHYLSNDDRYWRAGLLASQFSAGANPDNMVYTTGLGHNSPQHPLIVDQRVTGREPPPGITVYGPIDLQWSPQPTFVNLFRDRTFPDPSQWPTTEAYFDVYLFPAVTEYTLHETIAPTAYTWGYFAAQQAQPTDSRTNES
jgi:endoglucanase